MVIITGNDSDCVAIFQANSVWDVHTFWDEWGSFVIVVVFVIVQLTVLDCFMWMANVLYRVEFQIVTTIALPNVAQIVCPLKLL